MGPPRAANQTVGMNFSTNGNEGNEASVERISVGPEWRLDKGTICLSIFAIAAAMRDFSEHMAGLIQELIGFGAAFDFAGLLSAGPQGHPVTCNTFGQLGPKLAPLFEPLILCSPRVLAHGI